MDRCPKCDKYLELDCILYLQDDECGMYWQNKFECPHCHVKLQVTSYIEHSITERSDGDD